LNNITQQSLEKSHTFNITRTSLEKSHTYGKIAKKNPYN